ncbi:hypothetical protein [Actinomadura fibrosa]|uniref:Alpha/beta hydrolase n=1 Tax=Actinomadura fibrosa TaxID=111802 RepID=A0ABW2XH81_9ACTN|nr:hypothetical protein [Actinomadura fibrosa]
MVAAATGLDPSDLRSEPGITLQAMSPERAANMDYFLSNDIPQCRRSALGAAEVKAAAEYTRVIAAVGRDSKEAWNHQCAVELSTVLGTPIEEFPGGHNGNTAFPTGFAERVHELFLAATSR